MGSIDTQISDGINQSNKTINDLIKNTQGAIARS